MLYTEMTKKAIRLAYEAHQGQVDKCGLPYFLHPYHLAEQMETEETITAALLHDVVEDTEVTMEDLAAMGFSQPVLEALALLTHDPSVSYMDYVAAIKPNPIARAVKLADLAHNSDLTRMDEVRERDLERVEKYRKAIQLLQMEQKEEKMDIKKRIEELLPEMTANLARLVKYDSVRGEALPGKPFGEMPAAVLAEALQLVEEMGFAGKNVDNYCGYAQIGEGKDIIGIAGHLDIVPAGEGWSTDPFTLTEKDGLLYGRGVSDDKGAVIAALYAMKLIQEECIPLTKRIRVIMGCAEETGSECMAHYMKVEEPVTVGFTPDGAFPGIYGEKSGMALMIRSKKTKIIEMTGGTVSNAVCARCKTVIPADAVEEEALNKALGETALAEFTVTKENDTLIIDARGVAAHASTPLLGVNAAGCTMQALAAAGMQDDFVDYYNSHIGTACDGAGFGINVKDDFGVLTFNNGLVKTQDGVISCTIDCRVPVTYTGEQMRELIAPYLEDEKGSCEVLRTGKPLFFPPDSPMVKALHQAYIDVTGDTVNQPQVIGGGTYAKELTGIIAFGCEFPNEDNRIHNADEFLKVEQFKMQVEIYVQAIKNLLAL